VDLVHVIKIKFNRLAGTFAGTGDAFAAMFLAWYTKLGNLKVCSRALELYKFDTKTRHLNLGFIYSNFINIFS